MSHLLPSVVNVLGTLLAFIIVFGILVFVHEFGHFFMAKLLGIRVEVFSFGYGKRLFGVTRGKTDYRVSLVPMGGYVKLLGEGMFEKDRPVAPDDMMAKPRWARFLVMLMGAVMNIILAVAALAVINGVGVRVAKYQDEPPVIGFVDPGSPAEKSGLRPDDLILAINRRPVKTWTDVELAVGSRPDKLITVEVRRDDRTLPVDLRTEEVTRYSMGYAGFRPRMRPQVLMVSAGSPAEKAGFKPNDIVLAVDGKPVLYNQWVPAIEASPGKPLQVEVLRGGRTVDLTVVPRLEGGVGRIGISNAPESELRKYGPIAAIRESVSENGRNITLILRFLKDLFTGQASTKQLGGPLEIANFSYAALRMGWLALLSWIGLISLQLGILNLLPIPVFDGGQIFVLIVEGIFRRDLGPKARAVWMQIGFVIFVALIGFVLLNDIVKRLPHGWGSLSPF